jgi:hypothetical protein
MASQASNHPTKVWMAIGCQGEDLDIWLFRKKQMDEIEKKANQIGSGYCEAVNEIVERDGLYDKDHRFRSIKAAIDYMAGNNMVLVEDFSYINY